MHPEGRFDAHVMDHGFSDGNKGPQFWVMFSTGDRQITGYFSLSERAAGHTIKKIRAIGFQGDDLGELADGQKLAGLWCSITVDHETYEGTTRAKVGWVNPYGQAGSQPARSEDAAVNVKRFNALLRKEGKKTPTYEAQTDHGAQQQGAPAGEPLPAEYDEANPPPADDDYPFD